MFLNLVLALHMEMHTYRLFQSKAAFKKKDALVLISQVIDDDFRHVEHSVMAFKAPLVADGGLCPIEGAIASYQIDKC